MSRLCANIKSVHRRIRLWTRTVAQNTRLCFQNFHSRDRPRLEYFSPSAALRCAAVPLYWARNPRKTNFGDELAPIVLHGLSGRYVRWSSLHSRSIVGGGSTLEWVGNSAAQRSKSSPLYIWGAGFMHRDSFLDCGVRNIQVSSVRGHLSLDRLIGCEEEPRLGDLALLTSRCGIVARCESPKSVLFIPHYADEGSAFEKELAARWNDVRILKVSANPRALIKSISSARLVISSALHPQIVADSFGVPNIWVPLSNRVGGGAFKFEDYLSVFDLEPSPLTPNNFFRQIERRISSYQRPNLRQITDSVHESLNASLRAYDLALYQRANSFGDPANPDSKAP